jgi:hypothetical protein
MTNTQGNNPIQKKKIIQITKGAIQTIMHKHNPTKNIGKGVLKQCGCGDVFLIISHE